MDSGTIGQKFDYLQLKTLNRDSDGSVLSARIEAFLETSEAVLGRMPTDWEQYLVEVPADLKHFISEMTNLTARIEALSAKPVGERSSTLTNLTNEVSAVMVRQVNSLLPLVRLMAVGSSRMDPLRDVSNVVAAANLEARKVEEASAKIEALLRSAEAATARAAASGRARIFAKEAQGADRAARIWLGFSAASLAVLLFVAAKFASGGLIPRPTGTDSFALANYVLAKVLILGSLLFAVTFGTRQYSVYRHNSVMNRHRSNALSTYRAIVQASRGEESHDIILTEAAEAIFRPQDSGFVKGAATEGPGVVQLVQGLMKGAGPTSHA